ncbi:MAG: hypothetical protein LUO93_01215 [Methanomicrobiales archaeon]|nr:hypothetical protein [Methanomicrobiales archaeon]
MIFPRECKEVGYADTHPCGDRVYFLSRFLVQKAGEGYEVLRVDLDPAGKGMLRRLLRTYLLATPDEVSWYPQKVQLHDRRHLVDLAVRSGTRCTIFSGYDEHITFVCDPDPSSFLTVHVYDIEPPLPTLSATLRELEATGLFGSLDVGFVHHVRDLASLMADVYPCRAAGFPRTLDADTVLSGDRVAGCLTAVQLLEACGVTDTVVEDICPLGQVKEEPFIARCCRSEREGIGIHRGKFGAVVHWAAPPWRVARILDDLVRAWREREA